MFIFSRKYKTYRSWQRNYLKTHTKDTPYYKRISRGHMRNPFLTLKELRGHKEKPKPDIIYLLVWIDYTEPTAPYSWYIDQMKVTRHPAFEKGNKMLENEQISYCLKYLSKAFTKAIGKRTGVISTNWQRDLGKYAEYEYTRELLERMGIQYFVDWQPNKIPEENLELWRTGG